MAGRFGEAVEWTRWGFELQRKLENRAIHNLEYCRAAVEWARTADAEALLKGAVTDELVAGEEPRSWSS